MSAEYPPRKLSHWAVFRCPGLWPGRLRATAAAKAALVTKAPAATANAFAEVVSPGVLETVAFIPVEGLPPRNACVGTSWPGLDAGEKRNAGSAATKLFNIAWQLGNSLLLLSATVTSLDGDVLCALLTYLASPSLKPKWLWPQRGYVMKHAHTHNTMAFTPSWWACLGQESQKNPGLLKKCPK